DIAEARLFYQLADQDLTLSTAPMTTLGGFGPANDRIEFNGTAADAGNFFDAGSFTTFAAMETAVDAALATHQYVFATYTGIEDINHNNIADDEDSGILAWDG